MPKSERFVEAVLRRLAGFVLGVPVAIVVAYVVLAALSVAATLAWLELETDQNALVSNDLEYNRRYLRYLEEFGDQEYIFVVLRSRDAQRAREAADAVDDAMQSLVDAGHLQESIHRVDTTALRRDALLLFDAELLAELARVADDFSEPVRELLAVDDGLVGLVHWLQQKLDGDVSALDPALAEIGFEVLGGLTSAMARAVGEPPAEIAGGEPPSLTALLSHPTLEQLRQREPWNRLVSDELLDQLASDGYFTAGDLHFVFLMPRKNYSTLALIQEPLERVRQARDRVQELFPDVDIGLTGRPVLQAVEMETTDRDMRRAAILATFVVLALFVIFFRAIRRPFLTACVLVLAISITFGIVTVTIGHLNLLSIVFAVMLVSLGTDFGVHVIARYQEELAAGKSVEDSLTAAQVAAGTGNITAATTTAVAFYAALLVDFRGLAELGFIAGSGVLVCMISMNTLLPALLLLTDGRSVPRGRLAPLRMSWLRSPVRRPIWTLGACAVVIAALAPGIASVRFDSNLLELQARDLPAVKYEELITRTPGIKTWYAVYLTESLDEVRRLVSELERPEHGAVIGKVESYFDYVPPGQEARRQEIARIRSALVGEHGELTLATQPEGVDVARLEEELEGLLDRLDALLAGALRQGRTGAARLEPMILDLETVLDAIDEDSELASRRLGAFQDRVVGQVRGLLQIVRPLLRPTELTLEDHDPFVRQRVQSPESGRYIVYAYPARDIWEEESMAEFVALTESIDPTVTGVPGQVYHSTLLMQEGFLLAALYALIAVFVLIWLDFLTLRDTLLAMIPVAVGMTLALSLMPWLGLSFNLANFFVMPIIIGTGINGGVHLLHRYRERRLQPSDGASRAAGNGGATELESGTESRTGTDSKTGAVPASEPTTASMAGQPTGAGMERDAQDRPSDGVAASVIASSTGTSVVLGELTTITALGMLFLSSHRGVASLGQLLVLGCSSCLFASVIVLPSLLALGETRRSSRGGAIEQEIPAAVPSHRAATGKVDPESTRGEGQRSGAGDRGGSGSDPTH